MIKFFLGLGLILAAFPTTLLAAPLKVVTTVAPITDMVMQVSGGNVEVVGVIPQGRNSHTFEPSPSDAKILVAADLIIVNGLHLETPIINLAEKVKRKAVPIVKLGNATLRSSDWKYDFSFPKEKGNPNPHLWPNVSLAQRYVSVIEKALSKQRPDLASTFEKNANKYKKKLHKLDNLISKCMANIPPKNRKLITYHDSFAYFAPRYAMKVIGAVQPADFAEPSPKDVARMILQIRKEQVPAIFGSEVFPSTVLAQIAKETGTKYINKLRDDSFPGKPGEKEHSYIGMMYLNTETITEALGGDKKCMRKFNYD
ncbi:MAG: metal ABC transporter substrate-binding protein [Rhodospirillales bacterium]|nr:metal ABC transporter substrate-binding protein [Rhodospirillales bacterium]